MDIDLKNNTKEILECFFMQGQCQGMLDAAGLVLNSGNRELTSMLREKAMELRKKYLIEATRLNLDVKND